jgi:hypothetical protein
MDFDSFLNELLVFKATDVIEFKKIRSPQLVELLKRFAPNEDIKANYSDGTTLCMLLIRNMDLANASKCSAALSNICDQLYTDPMAKPCFLSRFRARLKVCQPDLYLHALKEHLFCTDDAKYRVHQQMEIGFCADDILHTIRQLTECSNPWIATVGLMMASGARKSELVYLSKFSVGPMITDGELILQQDLLKKDCHKLLSNEECKRRKALSFNDQQELLLNVVANKGKEVLKPVLGITANRFCELVDSVRQAIITDLKVNLLILPRIKASTLTAKPIKQALLHLRCHPICAKIPNTNFIRAMYGNTCHQLIGYMQPKDVYLADILGPASSNMYNQCVIHAQKRQRSE